MWILLILAGMFFIVATAVCLILTLLFWLVDLIADFLERRK
jgi:hypothetical protein